MNEQLQAQVTVILKQFSDGISTAGDVAMRELPDIAQQYVAYGFVKGILGVTICGAFTILLLGIMCWAIKSVWSNANKNINECDYYPFIFIPIPFLLLSFVALYANAESLILNITAPKIWLLLEIKNILS